MSYELPQLPYGDRALEPYISERTLSFHFGKHHKSYVDNLNKLTANTAFEKEPLEKLIRDTYEDEKLRGIFNNAAQHYNHSFYWNSMKPGSISGPQGMLRDRLNSVFGNLDEFKKQFKEAATTVFGSGWAWLVLDKGTLAITKTSNALPPFILGQKPLLTCDVWEHAYYLDYQNRRGDMVSSFLDNLVNWEFVEHNLNS